MNTYRSRPQGLNNLGLISVINNTLDEMIAGYDRRSGEDKERHRQVLNDDGNRMSRIYGSRVMEQGVKQAHTSMAAASSTQHGSPAMSPELLQKLVADREALKSHVWSDHEIGKIPSAELAGLAYQESLSLPKEFGRCETFIAFWRALQRKQALTRS